MGHEYGSYLGKNSCEMDRVNAFKTRVHLLCETERFDVVEQKIHQRFCTRYQEMDLKND